MMILAIVLLLKHGQLFYAIIAFGISLIFQFIDSILTQQFHCTALVAFIQIYKSIFQN